MKKLFKHKFLTALIAVVIVGGGYFGYGKIFSGTETMVSYATAAVEKGTLVTSVSGSGQISASNQLDIKPKVAGDVVWIGIKTAKEVKAGQALLSLDNTDAKKEITDAELSIEEAQLNLDKAIAQAPIDYADKLGAVQTAKDDLEKEYEDVFSTVSNAFLSLPTIITYAEDILYGTELSNDPDKFNVDAFQNIFMLTSDKDLVRYVADIAAKEYKTARDAYDKDFLQFKNLTLYSGKTEKEKVLDDTLDTARSTAQSIKSELNLLDTIVDISTQRNQQLNSTVTGFQTNLKTYLTTANSNLSTLLSQKSSLKDAKTAITSAENSLNIFMINNPTGVNPIDLQISRNAIEQKRVALADLRTDLANYTVYAPFDGTIAEIDVKKGDSVSAGTTVVILISHQKIAEISLNEVDAAKAKVGQKATLTFDAVEDLSIAGEVEEIDTLGTVSQGVVSYTAKITFDTQDNRVKSGMSVSAAIITDVKQDVLLVPSSAIKSNGEQYVTVIENDVTRNQMVEVGLSNDTMTEITSGLKEGDKVVTQTTTSATTKTTTKSQGNSFGIPGLGGAR